MNRVSLIALTAMLSCVSFAWDVEHDELAQLVGETLPKEIKEFYTFDDFATLMAYCHFPDMTDFEPRRFHTLDDIEEIVGRRYPLRRDANSDGWSKPACAQEVRLADGIEPIAYLDNGSDRFCVAARRGNVTWLPIYMLSPFLFSDDTSLDFGSLRLDSFAERVLMAALE